MGIQLMICETTKDIYTNTDIIGEIMPYKKEETININNN